MLKLHKYFLLLIVWLGIIYSLSLVGIKINGDPKLPSEDKIVHVIFYLVLTILLYFYFKRESRGSTLKKSAFLLSITLSFINGTIIEFFQWAFTSTRSAEWEDVLANSMGILAAVIFLKLFGKVQKN